MVFARLTQQAQRRARDHVGTARAERRREPAFYRQLRDPRHAFGSRHAGAFAQQAPYVVREGAQGGDQRERADQVRPPQRQALGDHSPD